MDSQAAIGALSKHTTRSKVVRESNVFLNNLANLHKVSIEWVLVHSGDTGNEKVDILARKGSETHPITPEPISVVSIKFAKRKIRCIYSLFIEIVYRYTYRDL